MDDERDITALLHEAAAGDRDALEELTRQVYGELERFAERRMRAHFGAALPGVTLEPAALVNETFLKLLAAPRDFANRRHFYAFATRVLLRVLTDYERARAAAKRGGNAVRVTLDGLGAAAAVAPRASELAAALDELERQDARKAEGVRLRLLWGLDPAEIADTLAVSARTVERDWRFARSWLRTRLTAS